MEVSDYLNQPGLDKLIQEARFIKSSGKRFSDVEDAIGLQYVDLFCEAQGVTFMSILGYSFILEEAGISFFNLGGISSGALNAMVVAALGQKQYKSISILRAFNKFSINEDSVFQNPNRSTKLVRKVSQLRNRLFQKNNQPSKQNYSKRLWISKALEELGINTISDLNKAISQKPNGLKHIFGGNINDLSPRLAIITSDISTHTKVEMPKMAELYWHTPESVSPVEMIMASTAIPYFQDPYILEDIPKNGDSSQLNWIKLANFRNAVPKKIRFMDGSMIYHPPFNLFHRKNQLPPRMPTFSVMVSPDKSKSASTHPFASSLINSTKEKAVKRFLDRNPECKSLLTQIDLPVDCDMMNFNVSDEDKLYLFKQGVKAGLDFLADFDWPSYKSKRIMDADQKLIQAALDVRFAS